MTTTSHLATRCGSCGTAFRVVQDQLKVSEGWVRCGRCDTVFNALEQLFNLQVDVLPPGAAGSEPLTHESLPELPADDAPKPPMADAFSAMLRARGGTTGSTGSAAAEAASSDDAVSAPAPFWPPRGAAASNGPSTAATSADFAAWPTARSPHPAGPETSSRAGSHADADRDAAYRQAEVDLLLDVPGDSPPVAGLLAAPSADHADPVNHVDHADAFAPLVAAGAGDAEAAAPSSTPEFIRAAERDARWRRPPVRRALAATSAVMLLALALQAAHQFRDGLAARWPAVRPVLAAWCGAVGCTIGPLRRIGDLTVENTALAPVPGSPGLFQLSVTLRNRGRLAVALPAVDLSLTDSNGQLVARRALSPVDFSPADRPPAEASPASGAAASATSTVSTESATNDLLVGALRPDADSRLQAVLATDARVVGYMVDLFYP